MEMIKFENTYGKFEIKIGEVYDFDMVDIKTGELYPHSEVQVIGERLDRIKTTNNDDIVYIEKNIICNIELSDI